MNPPSATVHPQDPSLPHFLDNDRMLNVAKALGKLALRADYMPKEFSRKEAVGAILDMGEPITKECDPIDRLKLNTVLIEREGGLDARLRSALDPIAEFLAAVA
jgi:hypothetical protein